MDASSRLTSKGQITLPKAVREALDLHTGDRVIFRVEGSRVRLAKTEDFLDAAGTVSVPAPKRGTAWDEVLRRDSAR